jgi:GntR family transcriptional regulator
MDQAATMRASLRLSSIPLYLQLAGVFRRRVELGRWIVGSQIPTIDDLAKECGVAKATIRQAVGVLEDEGLVSRFRAKGTFVNKTDVQSLWCEVRTDWSGLLRAREGAKIELLSKAASVVLPAKLIPPGIGKIAPGYRHLRRRHSRDGVPFMIGDVYLDERLARKVPKASYTSMTAMNLAASISGVHITDGRQIVTIGEADMEVATLLGMPLNAPICFIDRFAMDHGKLVLMSKGIYRGSNVRIDMKLK